MIEEKKHQLSKARYPAVHPVLWL